jgi:hexosaminidase
MPKEFVKKYIDLLALHKMNRFHWHLTDDQGWRIEIKRYPRLTEIRRLAAGEHDRAVSPPTRTDRPSTAFRHGGFYTQDDIREIVAYAEDRFVTIVPEIEYAGPTRRPRLRVSLARWSKATRSTC